MVSNNIHPALTTKMGINHTRLSMAATGRVQVQDHQTMTMASSYTVIREESKASWAAWDKMQAVFPTVVLQVVPNVAAEDPLKPRSSLMVQEKTWLVKACRVLRVDWVLAFSREVPQEAASMVPGLLEDLLPTSVPGLLEAGHSSRAGHKGATLVKVQVMAMVIPTKEDNSIGSKFPVAFSSFSALYSFAFLSPFFLLTCTSTSLAYNIKRLWIVPYLVDSLNDKTSFCSRRKCHWK